MNTNQTSGPLFNWTQGIYALHAFSLLVGIFVAWLFVASGLYIVSIWFIYRIARGWMRLRDGRPMYA